MLGSIITSMVSGGVDIHRFHRHTKALKFIARYFADGAPECQPWCHVLEALVDHARIKDALPASMADLLDFALLVPNLPDVSSDMANRYGQLIVRSISRITNELEDSDIKPSPNYDLEIATLLHMTRKKLHSNAYAFSASICVGCVPLGQGKKLEGIADAAKALREYLAHDTCADSGSIEGDFAENLDRVKENLLDALKEPEANRVYTGFPSIDDHVVIGPGHENRLVLIAAYSNGGKSSVLQSMTYNFAAQGKRVLFIPLECSAMEVWKRLAWQHLDRMPHLSLPSLVEWQTHPEHVTDQHIRNLDILIEDLRNGATLPGSVEVLHARTWDDIVEKVNAPAIPYDVLCVDYFGHLPFKGRDRREGICNIYNQAQALSLSYKENRGLVIVSPVQVSKQGVKNADEDPESEEWGIFDGSSLDTFTDMYRDADICIGLWSKGLLRDQNITKIHCFKSRTVFFPTFFATCDQRSRYFREISKPVITAGKVTGVEPQRTWAEVTDQRDRFINFAYNDC